MFYICSESKLYQGNPKKVIQSNRMNQLIAENSTFFLQTNDYYHNLIYKTFVMGIFSK